MDVAVPTVIVLASGRGERYVASGGTGSKLQAMLAGKPVLTHTLAAVQGSGLPWHLEDAGHPGMGDSIAAAVRRTADAAGWLILPGDLPLVEPDTLRRVADALRNEGVQAAQPRYRGERGHPVGFARACREALMALEGHHGAAPVLRDLRAAGRVAEVDVDDIGVVTDIDTVAALAAAQVELLKRLSAA
ncbi:MAG: nucleotidyltransferase family protein [Variovorax sp.]